VEVGYRSDYDPNGRKYQEKLMQHHQTITRLKRHYNVDYQVWDIGHTGVLPSRLLEQARRLGVEDPDKLMLDIHVASVRYAHIIIQERRRLEQQLLSASRPPRGSQSRFIPATTSNDHTTAYRHVPEAQRRTKAPPR
jgi:hypothetical protein